MANDAIYVIGCLLVDNYVFRPNVSKKTGEYQWKKNLNSEARYKTYHGTFHVFLVLFLKLIWVHVAVLETKHFSEVDNALWFIVTQKIGKLCKKADTQWL